MSDKRRSDNIWRGITDFRAMLTYKEVGEGIAELIDTFVKNLHGFLIKYFRSEASQLALIIGRGFGECLIFVRIDGWLVLRLNLHSFWTGLLDSMWV